MEYFWGDLDNAHSGTHNTKLGYQAPNGNYYFSEFDITNISAEKLKYYFMVPSDMNVATGAYNGIYYQSNNTTVYNDKTIHYSWNYGRRFYSDENRMVPAKQTTSSLNFFAFREAVASETTVEVYSKTVMDHSSIEHDYSQMCDGATSLRKIVFNNVISLPNDAYIIQYSFRDCTSLRFCDLGNVFKSSYTNVRATWGTFKGCSDITINLRDCDFSGISSFNTSATRSFIPNNSTVRIIYDTAAKLGVMQTTYPSAVYTHWAILCETQNPGEQIYMATYNGDDWIGGDDGVYNDNDVIVSIHEALDYASQITSDSNYRNLFDGNDMLVKIDLSLVNTSHVTNMSYMFRSCTSLQELNLGGLFDTRSVTNFTDFLGSGTNAVPLTCKIYYNPNTMNQALLNMYPNYNWIKVDERFRIF